MGQLVDLSGRQFGMWLVLNRAPNGRGTNARWVVKCACGTVKEVIGSSLARGKSKSCGCLERRVPVIGGKGGFSHAMSETRTYNSWVSMKARCSNPNLDAYKYYGARGVKVCERWMSFENFYADMGERPEGMSLDRKNPNGHYEPDNCVWSDLETQVNNRRNSRLYLVDGVWRTCSQLMRYWGVYKEKAKKQAQAYESKINGENNE